VRYFNAFGRRASYAYEVRVYKTQLELLQSRTAGGDFWGTRHGLAQYDREKPAAVAAGVLTTQGLD